MDDILLKKRLHDDDLIELTVVAMSELVIAKQNCYIDRKNLSYYSDILTKFTLTSEDKCYVQFGEKVGNWTPAFSLRIIKIDRCGHVQVEIDIEVKDNETRMHRCCFYVNSDIGAIERFGKRIGNLGELPIGTIISLNCSEPFVEGSLCHDCPYKLIY